VFKRRARIGRDQWPSLLLFLSGSLRAGLSLEQALDSLRDEAPEPLKSALAPRMTAAAWAPVDERVRRLLPEPDLALARAALLLTHRAGGQTAALLDRAAQALQTKNEMEDRARALSAQGRASAWIVGLTPAAALLGFSAFAPDYAAPLFTTKAGLLTLFVATVMVVCGLMLVQRMVRVEP
jgi:tight adherence protein B